MMQNQNTPHTVPAGDCRNPEECPYCMLRCDPVNYNHYENLDEKNRAQIMHHCQICHDNCWMYSNLSWMRLSRFLYPDPVERETIINNMTKVSAALIAGVKTNNIEDTTLIELADLFRKGCFMKNYIADVFLNNVLNNAEIEELITRGSLHTILQYLINFSIQYDFDQMTNFIYRLYLNNRYDVLDSIYDIPEVANIGNTLKIYICKLIHKFIKCKQPITQRIYDHLCKHHDSENIIKIICTDSIYYLQRSIDPCVEILNNLPPSIGQLKFLDCSYCKPLPVSELNPEFPVGCIPSSYMPNTSNKDINGNIRTFFETHESFKYLKQIAFTPEIKQTVIKIFSDSFNRRIYVSPEQYEFIINTMRSQF